MSTQKSTHLKSRILAWIKGILRLLVAIVASVAVVWSFVSNIGIFAVIFGATIGVLFGHTLASSRLKGSVIVGAVVGAFLFSSFFAWFSSSLTFLSALIGPGSALAVGLFVRYALLTFTIIATLRIIAVRIPRLAPLELIATIAAFVVAFAPHRDGVVIRPLWFSDWAWHHGIDPANGMILLGGLAAVTMLAILLLESEEKLSPATWLAIPILALIAGSFLSVQNISDPPPGNNLGLTDSEPGDPPQTQMPPSEHGRNGNDGEQENNGGQEQAEQEGGGQPQDQQFDNPPQQQQQSEPTPLAVVILENDYEPPSGAFYFRQEIWSDYNGRRLVQTRQTRRQDIDQDVMLRFPVRETAVEPPPESAEEEEEEGEESRIVVDARVAMLEPHNAPFALTSALTFSPSRNPDPARFWRSYRFSSLSRINGLGELMQNTSGETLDPEVLDYYLTTPDDPRYQELTDEILGDLEPFQQELALARALAIKIYLDENLIYSTRHRHAGAPHPTAEFLFGDQTGYCVHFAHAATFLFRSAGIPARVGSGYMVPAEARQGSAILLTSSNAHAWPEIYLDEAGWVVLDISAATILDEPMPPTDPEIAQLLAEMARDVPPDPNNLNLNSEKSSLMPFFTSLAKILVVAALIGLYLRKLWRRFAPWSGDSATLPKSGYILALDLLGEAGIRRIHGETREHFARRISDIMPSLEEMTRLHVLASIGPATDEFSGPTYDPKHWKELIRELRSELEKNVSFKRRAIGALNPVSYFFIK